MKHDLNSFSATLYSALSPTGLPGVSAAALGVAVDSRGAGDIIAREVESRRERRQRSAGAARATSGEPGRRTRAALHAPIAARMSGGAAVALPGVLPLGESDLQPRSRSGARELIRGGRLQSLAGATAAQRWLGIGLTLCAWLLLLLGLAHLVMATLHNRDEELGLGIDATARGAWLCLGSLMFAACGISLWLLAERRLRPRASS